MANVVEVIFRGVDQISRNTSQINSSLTVMRRTALRAAAGLTAAFGGAALIRSIGRAADTMTLVESRIRLVTESVEELNSVQERLFRVAQETRSAFAPTVELYARVARSTKDLGLSQQEVINLTRTVNQSIQISGATAQEASAGVIQFAQALASGELRGEELRSVMEQLSGLSIVLAEGLGVGIGELRNMAEAGELTAERIIRVLRDQAPRVQAEFEQITPTIASSFQTLQNALTEFIDDANDATGATGFLTDAIRELGEAVTEVGDELFPDELERLQDRLDNIRDRIEAIRESGRGQTLGAPGPGAFLFGDVEASTEELDALNAELIEVVKRISDIQNRQNRLLDLPLISVDSEANLARLDDALEKFHDRQEERAREIADSLIREFEPIEDRISRELAEVDIAAHLIPDDLEARIRARIKAQRLDGLGEIIVEDIVNVEAMDRRLEELLDHTDDTFDQMEAIADEAARSMQRAFSDFFFDPFQDGLDGMVVGFLNAIRRMLADQAAVKFFELLFGKKDEEGGGLLGDIFKVITGGGTPVPFPGGPPRAHGGFTIPGALHSINEREPEFLLTNGRSEVVPLSKMAANGAGGGARVFSPTTTFQLTTSPLTRDQLEQFSESREAKLFAEFKRMLRDDGLD